MRTEMIMVMLIKAPRTPPTMPPTTAPDNPDDADGVTEDGNVAEWVEFEASVDEEKDELPAG
jgi:hypothetical protein